MTQILMPALSPTMEEGKLAKWHVKEGDAVKAGDILAEIETDKATMEFESIDEGRIGKILISEGTEGVKVNQPIAVLLGDGESSAPTDIPSAMAAIREAIAPAKAEPKSAPTRVAASPAPKAPAPVSAPAPVQPNGHAGRIFSSPLARRIAQMSGIDLSAVQGSGPRGRIVKSDVEAAAKGGVIALVKSVAQEVGRSGVRRSTVISASAGRSPRISEIRFCTICSARSANSSGLPRRLGNGMVAARLSCTSLGSS